MDNKENPKCSGCKCYWKPDETNVKSSGLYFKICKKCRDYKKKNADKIKKYYEENADKVKKYREENADNIKEYKKKYREENADKIKEQRKKYREENADKIKEQRKKYREENVDKDKERCKKYREENTDKVKEINKKYYEENADKVKEQRKKYYEENADKVKEQRKKYYEDNKCEHNKRKEYCKVCNLQLYLINLQRKHIYRCFKSSTLDKTKHSVEYLDCSVEDLIEHFNKKIEYFNTYLATDTVMTWDNIHIDHIKPVSRFDLDNEDEFLDCCHYTNLQPLIDVDNLEKSNRWTDENEKYWLENIKGNVDYHEVYV